MNKKADSKFVLYDFREELVAYYSQLTEEAARREQKALWRVKRAKLDIERTNFLRKDEELLQEEMKKYTENSVCNMLYSCLFHL